MENARLFNCNRCHKQVTICSTCDRGNIYCSDCAPEARAQAQRAASARYQNTHQGKLNHAERQKRYQERKKNDDTKMTYRGSAISGILASCESTAQEVDIEQAEEPEKLEIPRCHFCCRDVSTALRIDFMRSGTTKRLISSIWTTGP